jgi:hypothetical protein
MDYKIVKATPSNGTIDVMYLDDTGKSLGVYAIDVPIIYGVYISGNELEALIQSKAPTWLLTRKSEVTTAQGFEAIAAKVDENALQNLIIANTPAGLPVATVQEVLAAYTSPPIPGVSVPTIEIKKVVV